MVLTKTVFDSNEFALGFLDFADEKTCEENPFQSDTEQWDLWKEGWMEGMRHHTRKILVCLALLRMNGDKRNACANVDRASTQSTDRADPADRCALQLYRQKPFMMAGQPTREYEHSESDDTETLVSRKG
jgi:hypothetical protein